MKKLLSILKITFLLLFFHVSTVTANPIIGAGATFPYPLYSEMFIQYFKEFGVQINYQAIGSGGGVRHLSNKLVDFGATDAYTNSDLVKTINEDIVYVPTCLSGISVVYNVPGQPKLNLDAETIADIYLGKIKRWNDKRIKQLNPDVDLPSKRIIPVHRSDSSGTTFIFTEFLTKYSEKFKSKIGHGKSVPWKRGVSGKGNAGVTSLVKDTPGSIGYVISVYAIKNNLPSAAIKNRSGQFVEPTLAAISEAGNVPFPEDTLISIVDTKSRKGYPISGISWVILYKDQSYDDRSIGQARELKSLLKWMVSKGQRYVEPLHYAALTDEVTIKAKAIIDRLTFDGKSF